MPARPRRIMALTPAVMIGFLLREPRDRVGLAAQCPMWREGFWMDCSSRVDMLIALMGTKEEQESGIKAQLCFIILALPGSGELCDRFQGIEYQVAPSDIRVHNRHMRGARGAPKFTTRPHYIHCL